MNLDNQLVLVPGGAGFIGSHLCDRLLACGYEVIALDNLSTGHVSHLSHLVTHPRFRLIVHDVTRPLPPAVERAERIFNLACPASPAYYQQHPVDTALSCAEGTWRLLNFAHRRGARMLLASTSEIYGDPEVHPQHEDYRGYVSATGPRSCYDEGKRFAEALFFACHREWRLPLRVARLFNTYGPRLQVGDGRVVSNFIVQALRGQPLTVYGDGMQTRSLCYIDDTVDGLLSLMDSAFEAPVNLGNPCEITVLALAEQVLALTGSRSRIEHLPAAVDDPRRRRPDIARARQVLGWEPRVALVDGLTETIAYFRHVLGMQQRAFVSAPVRSAA